MTTTLNIELRAIKYMASLSEETHCYSATVYLDGKPVCDVSNHGHGGCDEQHWRDQSAKATIEAYFAALPKRDTGMMLHDEPFLIQPDLEDWCGQQVTRWLVTKDFKRIMSKKVLVLMPDGTEMTWGLTTEQLDRKVKFQGVPEPVVAKDHILAKSGDGAIIANLLSPAELEAVIDRRLAA